MTAIELRCARCILEWYNVTHTEPEQTEYELKDADVLYNGISLCEDHLISHVRRNAHALAEDT